MTTQPPAHQTTQRQTGLRCLACNGFLVQNDNETPFCPEHLWGRDAGNIDKLIMPGHKISGADGYLEEYVCKGSKEPGYVHINTDGTWHCNRCGWVTPEPVVLPPVHRTTWVSYRIEGDDRIHRRELFTDLVALGPGHVKWLLSNLLLTPVEKIELVS